MLLIYRKDLEEIFKHALLSYPEEACGLILGKKDDDRRVAVKVKPSKNVYEGDRRRKYMIDPMELYHAEIEAESEGLSTVGIYHSHPDYPAVPSNYDIEMAWPNMVYLIISNSKECVKDFKAWLFDSKSKQFVKYEIVII